MQHQMHLVSGCSMQKITLQNTNSNLLNILYVEDVRRLVQKVIFPRKQVKFTHLFTTKCVFIQLMIPSGIQTVPFKSATIPRSELPKIPNFSQFKKVCTLPQLFLNELDLIQISIVTIVFLTPYSTPRPRDYD